MFNLIDEIKKLEESPRRDLNIIALYINDRKPDLRSKEQLSVCIKRHLRPAGQLKPFENDQILDAMHKAKALTDQFTLETLIKILTK